MSEINNKTVDDLMQPDIVLLSKTFIPDRRTQMTDRNIIIKITKTKIVNGLEIEQSFIDIDATIREGFAFFNEMMIDALMGENAQVCKEKAELARYTASKKFVDAFGIPWKAVGNVLSFMSMGDEKQAIATVRRCML